MQKVSFSNCPASRPTCYSSYSTTWKANAPTPETGTFQVQYIKICSIIGVHVRESEVESYFTNLQNSEINSPKGNSSSKRLAFRDYVFWEVQEKNPYKLPLESFGDDVS